MVADMGDYVVFHCFPFYRRQILCRPSGEKEFMINEADLEELESVLTGVTVGVGSQILIFGSGATVLVQCPFISETQGKKQQGHGEHVHTSQLFYDYLNSQVIRASIEEQGVLVLEFEEDKLLRIVPEYDGLESYVISSRLGICPVAVV